MQTQQEPLVLTLHLDPGSQAFFDAQRTMYFPPERNFLKAHLTLFHQLPNSAATREFFESLKQAQFQMDVTGLLNLGGGVAYSVTSEELLTTRKTLAHQFKEVLIPQDRQGFRAHITVQNKVLPTQAKTLLNQLANEFESFKISAVGIDLWAYLGGPWRHESFYPFT